MIRNFAAIPGLCYPSVSSSPVGEELPGEGCDPRLSGEMSRWLGPLCR